MSMPDSNIQIQSISYGGEIENEESIPKYIDPIKIQDTELTRDILSFCGSEAYQKIYEACKDQRDIMFEQINKEGLILKNTQHKSGNFFIKKILDCNDDDKDKEKHKIIYKALIEHIKELSSVKESTYIIQKLINDVVEDNDLDEIANKLGVFTDIEYFIDNENSNHVIQCLINRQKKEENDKIFENINNFVKVANDQYGCYIIQAILNNCTDNCYYSILKKSCENIVALCKDNANYIFQYFFENEDKDKDKKLDIIYQAIKGNIYELSKEKKAVFVVKEALKLGNENQRKDIINELLELNTDKEDPLISLAKNQYGNYVIQDLLDYCEPETLKIIIKRIYSEPNIKKDKFGKYVCKKIKEINN